MNAAAGQEKEDDVRKKNAAAVTKKAADARELTCSAQQEKEHAV